MSIPFKLCLPRVLLDEMIAQAKAELPNECVGLLAGTIVGDHSLAPIPLGKVEKRYPLVNELASPTEFFSEPRSMLAADRDMRSNNFEMLAIYHSHPTSRPFPSAKDRERSYSSNVVNVIISLKGDPPEVRAWWITEADHREAEWELI
ncbi:MAG: M67 family metallopeptidase [Gemmataceae bacterium]